MDATPRTLIRGVQKDLQTPPSQGSQKTSLQKHQQPVETRNLMKAFIGADATNSVEHKKILDNPVFSGHYPRIEDRVFTMERFAGDRTPTENKTISLDKTDQVKRTKKTDVGLIVDPYEGSSPSQFTGFEHFLLCINVSLFIGIVLTMIVLGLFFLFLNSALYLKEEIS